MWGRSILGKIFFHRPTAFWRGSLSFGIGLWFQITIFAAHSGKANHKTVKRKKRRKTIIRLLRFCYFQPFSISSSAKSRACFILFSIIENMKLSNSLYRFFFFLSLSSWLIFFIIFHSLSYWYLLCILLAVSAVHLFCFWRFCGTLRKSAMARNRPNT